MKITTIAAAVAATAVAFGMGAVNAAPASAADNIKIFGEQERLNNPDGTPYIGYTVNNFGPSSDPVPHNGKLYSATLFVDGFGGNAPAMIERFGARSESGVFYPSIWGASNMSKLYFDVVGEIPNSVVWNDGIRDILAWVPGEIPLEGLHDVPEPPPAPAPPAPAPAPVMESESTAVVPESKPVENDPAIVATPNDLAPQPFELTEADVAQPGFNR